MHGTFMRAPCLLWSHTPQVLLAVEPGGSLALDLLRKGVFDSRPACVAQVVQALVEVSLPGRCCFAS